MQDEFQLCCMHDYDDRALPAFAMHSSARSLLLQPWPCSKQGDPVARRGQWNRKRGALKQLIEPIIWPREEGCKQWYSCIIYGCGAYMHSLSNLEMRDAAMQRLGCVCMRMINSHGALTQLIEPSGQEMRDAGMQWWHRLWL